MPQGNSNFLDKGIGQSAREQHSYGRPTGHQDFQNFGIHVGIVADDIDEMKMQRVHVYIPGVSALNPDIRYDRYTNTREPMNADGTPGKQIMSKRRGFMLAHPITPSSGSDKTREPNNSDGRNSQIGESNGYGFTAQPRNGDMVLCCFANGDPSSCFYVGHIPKTGENEMIPGLKAAKTTASGSGTSTDVGPSITKDPAENTPKPQTVFFNNLTDSGLIQDPLRGNGSSSSTRESPSRVTGLKTAGDPDTMMMGHQLVFDDHPDSQLIRARTSKGSQLLLCDTGNFIYLATATGKAWLEMDDSGNIHVYAHSSINYHAAEDFNLFCDRDFNLHVGGNTNWVTEGDTHIRMSKGGNITVGESGGDLDITTINNFHVKTQGEIRMGAKTGFTAKSAAAFNIQAANNLTVQTPQAIQVNAGSTSIKNASAMTINVNSGDFAVSASGNANLKGSTVNLSAPTINALGSAVNVTSGSITVPVVATLPNNPDPNQASLPLQHSVMMGPQTNAPPTAPQGVMQSAAAVVPQHEPWLGHVGQHPGHDSAVSPGSIPSLEL